MVPSVCVIFSCSCDVALAKCQPFEWNYLSMIKFQKWLVDLQCLGSVLTHFWQLFSRRYLSVWVTSSEGDSQLNGSYLRVARFHLWSPAYSIQKLMCHFWLIQLESLFVCMRDYLFSSLLRGIQINDLRNNPHYWSKLDRSAHRANFFNILFFWNKS